MNAEKALVFFLRVVSLATLTALGAVVMPHSWMDAIHRSMDLGELPDMPIVGYLTRTLSAMYAVHGALLGFLSFDVRRYLPAIVFFSVLWTGFGVVMIFLDIAVGLPLYWVASEGLIIIGIGLALYWLSTGLRRQIAREQRF